MWYIQKQSIEQELQNFLSATNIERKLYNRIVALATCTGDHAQVQEEMFRLYSFPKGKAVDQVFTGYQCEVPS